MGSLDATELKELFKRDRFAAFIGAEVIGGGDGVGRTCMKVGEQHLNGVGVIQGGALFTLADLAFAVACNSHGIKAVGLNASVNYLKPGLLGTTLNAEAREVSCGRRIGTYEVTVRDADGELVATFHGTAYRTGESW